MGKTSIEWTDASWNPIVGCTEVSPGCANCYAARLAATRLREVRAYQGLATGEVQKISRGAGSGHYFERWSIRWTGEVRFLPERLEEPLHWKKPQRIFVCDMGDLFHEGVKCEWKQKIFWVMREARQHTFQVLTKRPRLMQQFISEEFGELHEPIPNVWLGVSVENQHFADERIPLLLATPAAVRWISAEPLLGSVDLNYVGPTGNTSSVLGCIPCMRKQENATTQSGPHTCMEKRPKLDWVVCGGESGPNARPMNPEWARWLRGQCQAAGVPFFFKQWGEWAPAVRNNGEGDITWPDPDHDRSVKPFDFGPWMQRWGKKQSGRLLDGREWNEFPKNVKTFER